ncbi:MAG: metallophosphoesterase, partial [Deltaproteobacteria bacterium]|nr:metallophosphoesterase [Deltaproteobacteria bacterium]
ITDYSTRGERGAKASSPRRALAGAPADARKILLAHQPRSAFAAAAAGFDLQLSGHTHGGQFFPWNLFVGLVHPVSKGLGVVDGMQVYVNLGTCYWGPPVRTLVPPEITSLRLRRA